MALINFVWILIRLKHNFFWFQPEIKWLSLFSFEMSFNKLLSDLGAISTKCCQKCDLNQFNVINQSLYTRFFPIRRKLTNGELFFIFLYRLLDTYCIGYNTNSNIFQKSQSLWMLSSPCQMLKSMNASSKPFFFISKKLKTGMKISAVRSLLELNCKLYRYLDPFI